VTNREHPHLITRYDESVQSDVACLAERNHEFPNVAEHSPSEQRVRGQSLNGRLYGPGRRNRSVLILAYKEFDGALEVRQCACRIDYRRHGFGRAAF